VSHDNTLCGRKIKQRKVETNRIGPTVNLILEQRHEGEGVSHVDIRQKRVPRTENFKYKLKK